MPPHQSLNIPIHTARLCIIIVAPRLNIADLPDEVISCLQKSIRRSQGTINYLSFLQLYS